MGNREIMKTSNRRLWSIKVQRGITDVVEFSTPQHGALFTITQLELAGNPGLRELGAGRILAAAQCAEWRDSVFSSVIARNQEPNQ
jgi:hypothetical protein